MPKYTAKVKYIEDDPGRWGLMDRWVLKLYKDGQPHNVYNEEYGRTNSLLLHGKRSRVERKAQRELERCVRARGRYRTTDRTEAPIKATAEA